jgi:hypothetical protein
MVMLMVMAMQTIFAARFNMHVFSSLKRFPRCGSRCQEIIDGNAEFAQVTCDALLAPFECVTCDV